MAGREASADTPAEGSIEATCTGLARRGAGSGIGMPDEATVNGCSAEIARLARMTASLADNSVLSFAGWAEEAEPPSTTVQPEIRSAAEKERPARRMLFRKFRAKFLPLMATPLPPKKTMRFPDRPVSCARQFVVLNEVLMSLIPHGACRKRETR